MKRLSLTLLASLALLSAVLVSSGVGPASAAATYYVSVSGSDAASGSSSAPFRTVAKAVKAAPSGSSVVIRGGQYHESVQVYAKSIRLQAAPGESVVFDGSSVVTGWSSSGGDWSHSWTTEFAILAGEPLDPAVPTAAYSDQLFVDGVPQRQVLSRTEVVPGTFFHDRAANLLWMGSDPNSHSVSVSDLAWAIYFNRADGSSMSGIKVRRYATPARDMAAVRAYANNVVVENSTFEHNAYSGLSVMGAGVRISDSTFSNNGYMGAHAHKSTDLRVVGSIITGNNVAGFDPLHSAAGMKITETIGFVFDRNYVAGNSGPGIWTDITSSSITISNSLIRRNSRSGIELELSGQAVVAGNVAIENGSQGIWILETNDTEVWNNASYGNLRDIWVEDGPRTSSTSTAAANWDVNRVGIRNNVVGQGRVGAQALISVDDWTEKRSAAAMQVTSDYNAFWLPVTSATKNVTRWAMWPAPLAISATTAQATTATGQESHSRMSAAATNPFARNVAEYDYRMPVGSPAGATPPAHIAVILGVPTGVAIAPGPTVVMTPTGVTTPDESAVPDPSAPTIPTTEPPLPTTTVPVVTEPIPSAPTNLAAQGTATGANLSWGASSDDKGVSGYSVFRNGSEMFTVTSNTATVTDLNPGTHSFQVQAFDADGNRSMKTPPVAVTVVDPIPSVPTSLSGQGAAGSATLTWSASSDNDGVAGYAVYRNGTQILTVVATIATVSGLTPGGHSFQVQAFDADNNRSAKSPPVWVTVINPVPSVPTTLSGQGTVYGATLAWTASSDDKAVAGYAVYRNGTQIFTVASNNATVTGLIPGAHSFQVQSFDADGNRSAKSSPVWVTAIDPIPTVPTGIASVLNPDRTVTLTWNASTDNKGITSYIVYRNGVEIMTVASNSALIGGLAGGGSWFQVQAVDADGNRSAKTGTSYVYI